MFAITPCVMPMPPPTVTFQPTSFAVLDDGDVAEIVRVDVDVVVGRHREDELEFARQITNAVNRLFVLLRREPDLSATFSPSSQIS